MLIFYQAVCAHVCESASRHTCVKVARRWRITLDEVSLSIFPKKPLWHVGSDMVIAAGMGRRIV